VREETSLEVEPVRVIGVYSEGMTYPYPNGDQVHGVGIAFECRIVGGTLKADEDEISEVRFISPAELLAQPTVLRGMTQLWHDIMHPDQWPVLR
jgi:8-oxo-dGTP pyrophosphatase MutT (NUDIX family)